MPQNDEPRVLRPVRTPNWTTLALIGGLIVVVLLAAYFASSRNSDQDKLTQNALSSAKQASTAAPEKLCASKQTYDLIKRELFRRAAQLRGSDQSAFDQLAGYAVIRMENPVMESQDSATGAINCSGSLSLDLPPGVGIAGGRSSLTADLDYTIQPAADGSGNVVLLRNADAIVSPLATLARAGQPAVAAPATPVQSNQIASRMPPQPAPPDNGQGTAPQSQPPTTGTHPSFDCAKARTKGEIAVCSDGGLAALDRNMAAQYGRAMEDATPEQRDLLRRTRDRFLAYRDRCPSKSCIGEAYVGRMREIRDIAEDRWQPPR